VDHVAWQWGATDTALPFVDSYLWNDTLLDATGRFPAVHELLGIAALGPDEGVTALLGAATRPDETATVRASLNLLSLIDEYGIDGQAPLLQFEELVANPASASNPNGPAIPDSRLMLVLLENAVRDDRLDDAQRCLTVLQALELPSVDAPARLLRATNALGMALVRAGREDDAITIFTTLSSFYPGTQAAAYANEHIAHLSRDVMSD
jgi:hypothetical protein